MTPMGLIALAGLGFGAYYLATRKEGGSLTPVPLGSHRMPDGSIMSDTEMPEGAPVPLPPGEVAAPAPESAQEVLDPEMIALYQTCIYGHCSEGDCNRLLGYINSLIPQTAEERQWLLNVKADVTAACAAGPVNVDSPPELPDFAAYLQDRFDKCWTQGCSEAEVIALAAEMASVATFYSGVFPQDSASLRTTRTEFLVHMFGPPIGTAGTRHVGNCGCAACMADPSEDDVSTMSAMTGHDDDEPCCEACARGVGACGCSSMQDEERYTGGT